MSDLGFVIMTVVLYSETLGGAKSHKMGKLESLDNFACLQYNTIQYNGYLLLACGPLLGSNFGP